MAFEETLFLSVIDRIVNRLDLQEVKIGNEPFFTCSGILGFAPKMGVVRVYQGEKIRLVHIELHCSVLGLTSNMLYCFAPSHNALPHFTLDLVKRGKTFGLHCDLIPRTPAGWVDNFYHTMVYSPLESVFISTKSLEGVKPYKLREQQLSLMSPLLLCYFAEQEDKFLALGPAVEAYLGQWLTLVEAGSDWSVSGLSEQILADYDHFHRSQLFSPKVDPVWLFVRLLVGPKSERQMRSILTSPSLC